MKANPVCESFPSHPEPRPMRPFPQKRELTPQERQRRREESRRNREAERRSLAVLNDMPPEPRIDPATLAARRAEIPQDDLRDLTGRIFGDPNPADRRRAR